MTPLSTLVRAELIKLFRRPMTWILALVLLGIAVLIYGSLISLIFVGDTESGNLEVSGVEANELREEILPPDGVNFAATTTQFIGSILLIILAAGSVGSEFTWDTFRTNIFMGASRTRLLLAKFLALQVMVLIALVVGVAWNMGLALITWAIVGSGDVADVGFASTMVGDLALALLVNFVAMGMWVLISAGITLVTHSLATGLGITLALTFLGGQVGSLLSLLGTPGEWIARVIPNTGIDALSAVAAADPPNYVASDWLWIIANIVGWTVLIVVVCISRFRQMNLLAGS